MHREHCWQYRLGCTAEVTYRGSLPWVAAPLTGLDFNSICKIDVLCVMVVIVQWCMCVVFIAHQTQTAWSTLGIPRGLW